MTKSKYINNKKQNSCQNIEIEQKTEYIIYLIIFNRVKKTKRKVLFHIII